VDHKKFLCIKWVFHLTDQSSHYHHWPVQVIKKKSLCRHVISGGAELQFYKKHVQKLDAETVKEMKRNVRCD
jgi:hypothetical protein